MTRAVIGRILATSLYQAISELLPIRVEFYESWLSPKGFQARRVYVSGVRAVFSFLRREPGGFDPVVRRAGALAAYWMFDELPPIRRRLLQALPRALRFRAALALAKDLVRETWDQSAVKIRWRREASTLTITRSIFCDVREAAPLALCGFYAAGLETCLRRLDLEAEVRIERCQARDGGACTLVVTSSAAPAAAVPGARSLVLALLIAGGAAAAAIAQSPSPAVAERVLVMPFDNVSKQPRLAWLGEGASILVADNLRARGVDAMTRDERLRAFDRFQVPPLAALSRATVIRIGELVGAGDVIVGAIGVEGDALVLRGRRIHLDSGRLGAEVTVRGAPGAAADLFAELTARIWAGEPAGAAAPRTTDGPGPARAAVPMAAFEAYVKGLLADVPASQVALLTRAIQLAPDYGAARIALAKVHAGAENFRGAIDALAPIGDASPFWIEGALLTAVAQIRLRDYPAAWSTLTALHARAPSALVLNNMGIVRLRWPAAPGTAGQAAWYFSQARTLDPLDPDYLFNLGYAYWLDGDPEAAGYWLREAVRLSPTDASAHALLAQALHAGGHAAEAARELTLAQRLSSAFDGLELKSGAAAAPKGLERLKEALEPPRAGRIDAVLEMVGQREQRDLARFYLDRGRRLFDGENDHEAETELTRALYLSPYDAEAHLLLGRIYLRTGRLREAIDALKVSIWSQDTAPARVALAEAYLEAHDATAALAEVHRALVLDPGSLHAQKLLERLRQMSRAQL
jgi:Flp pilus assembly protein TadD